VFEWDVVEDKTQKIERKMATDSLILDKSVFLATCTQELCNFAETHTLILPETLFYECYTSKKPSRKNLPKALHQLLKAGAYLSYQLMQIVGDEGKNSCPCTSIIDYSWTDKLRANLLREQDTIAKEQIARIKNDRSKMAMAVVKLAKRSQGLESKQLGYLKEIRSLKMDRKQRFHEWIERVDKNNIHRLAAEFFSPHVMDPTRFCLSTEWLSWHYTKLIYAIVFEYCYLEPRGGCPTGEKAENDFMDIAYLAFFAKCDILLMKDAKSQEVAQAAFPNKKVYSSIREING
jgi:hypothetical protein